MNPLTRLLALAVVLTAAPLTFAASTVDLQVNGQITPRACTVSLSDNGVVDHGRIMARTLNPSDFTVLPNLQMGFSVSCDGLVLFALMGIDNKPESSLAPERLFGLGMNIHAPTERLGTVTLSLRGPVGDMQPMQTLTSPDKGITWTPEPHVYPGRYMGFAATGETLPKPIRQLVASLRVDTSISPANGLTLKEEVPLDGSITLDLIYL
ncbi:DUF1120 domain-containing protein [Pseudomonas reactans]|uniref:DUF1120 domain-containing protein n=1 Tax=Pseudomonas reactans TaxID=117680 RepID=A0ABX2QNB4_9PSED|nr:DUF1120 domain-containing protein [Pseudomonas reactans]NWA40692.1 DUF1120 domain-containing protein [Pseudomonas reactans]NWD93293.1 DUF1120 domain-containing protein [Pseudomonas reactans]